MKYFKKRKEKNNMDFNEEELDTDYTKVSIDDIIDYVEMNEYGDYLYIKIEDCSYMIMINILQSRYVVNELKIYFDCKLFEIDELKEKERIERHRNILLKNK